MSSVQRSRPPAGPALKPRTSPDRKVSVCVTVSFRAPFTSNDFQRDFPLTLTLFSDVINRVRSRVTYFLILFLMEPGSTKPCVQVSFLPDDRQSLPDGGEADVRWWSSDPPVACEEEEEEDV